MCDACDAYADFDVITRARERWKREVPSHVSRSPLPEVLQ
jgi:hypothetical protein